MSRIVPLYFPMPLIAEYRRRRMGHPVSARRIAAFPNGSGEHKLTLELTMVLLEDAREQQACHYGARRNTEALLYKGLVRQIERRLKEIEEADKIKESAATLRQIMASWAKP